MVLRAQARARDVWLTLHPSVLVGAIAAGAALLVGLALLMLGTRSGDLSQVGWGAAIFTVGAVTGCAAASKNSEETD